MEGCQGLNHTASGSRKGDFQFPSGKMLCIFYENKFSKKAYQLRKVKTDNLFYTEGNKIDENRHF